MKRLLFLVLGLVAVAAGVGGYLILRGQVGDAGGAGAAQQASQDFFAERGGGTPGPGVVTYGGGAPGVVGKVTQIDGDRLTIQQPADGTTATVHLAAGAAITRQGAGTRADLAPGVAVVVLGEHQGDVVNARSVQISGSNSFTMIHTPGVGAPPPGASGDQPVFIQKPVAGAPVTDTMAGPGMVVGTPGPSVAPVAGAITDLTGDRLTLKRPDGSTATVQLSDATQIRKPVAATPADIHVGDMVAAQGTQQGAAVEATHLDLLTPQAP